MIAIVSNSYCGITITILNHVKSYLQGFYLRPPSNRYFGLKACPGIGHDMIPTFIITLNYMFFFYFLNY